MNECNRIRENTNAEMESINAGRNTQMASQMLSGLAIFGVPTPNIPALILTGIECNAKKDSLDTSSQNQCESTLGQAGLQTSQEELQRGEDEEIMAINAEIDEAIRDSDLEVQRASSVALIKNLRAEGLLLAIEVEEAELSRRAAMTAMWSAYQEAAELAQEKARAVGMMVENSPDNTLTHPHFLQARLEYELSQEPPPCATP